MAKKELEHICKNCRLYDMEKRQCKVVVLFEGQRMHPPTEPEDHCIFEEESLVDEIKEVKWWVEDPNTGEKGKEGIVKIEYPPGFFSKEEV